MTLQMCEEAAMAAIALRAARHRPELEPLAPAVVSAAIPASFIDVDIENRGNPLIALAVDLPSSPAWLPGEQSFQPAVPGAGTGAALRQLLADLRPDDLFRR